MQFKAVHAKQSAQDTVNIKDAIHPDVLISEINKLESTYTADEYLASQ